MQKLRHEDVKEKKSELKMMEFKRKESLMSKNVKMEISSSSLREQLMNRSEVYRSQMFDKEEFRK